MNFRVLIFIFIFVLPACFVWQRETPGLTSGPRIWVALFSLDEPITVRCEGGMVVMPNRQVSRFVRPDLFVEKNEVVLEVNDREVRVDGSWSAQVVSLHPKDPEALWEIKGRRYRGLLRVFAEEKTWLVLDTFLEDYVAGVVACESGRNFHEEALKAQAVASRTFAWLRKTKEPRRLGAYDIFASSRDQVFKGVGPVRRAHREAVRQTQGMVLFASSDEILPAFYHSTCGGHTIEAQELGLTASFVKPLRGVACDHCLISPLWRWKYEIDTQELKTKLGLNSPDDLKDVQLMHSSQGHVREVRFLFANQIIALEGKELRKKLGFNKLKSSRFKCQLESNRLVIQGSGWGHGVGLCQWGSQGLARIGKSFRQILFYYYPGSRIQRMKLVG